MTEQCRSVYTMAVRVPKHINEWIRFQDFLTDLTGFTTELLSSLQGKKIEHQYQRVLFKFIERFHLNFVTVRNTWKEFLENSKYKHPFYLLLRSLVSDYITMVYLIDGLKVENGTSRILEAGFQTRYIEVSNSYFVRVEKEIEKQINDQKLTARERERFLKAEREFYPDHFEVGEKIKVRKIASLDPGTMTKHIKLGTYRELAGIYQYYFYFSQFEHFTIKTEELFDNNRDMEFKMLTGSVNYLIRGLLLNISVMKLNQEHSDKLSEVIRSFESKFSK